MKNILQILLVAVILSCATRSSAQSGPVVCNVNYDYDAAGNRIKREYKCAATWMPWDPAPWMDNSTLLSSVYPNPTTGVVTGVFTEAIGGEAGSATSLVSTMGGVVIFQQTYNNPTSSITIDLTQQPPGEYLWTISAFDKVETYPITKL